MPLIKKSKYKRPFYLFHPHLETIVPAFTRKINGVDYERERLILPDCDFLDIDWLDRGSRNLLVLTHGLEGDTQRHYMKGMAKLFMDKGWDVLAWNCRSCSGEINTGQKLYHHGDTEDISAVIQHALHTKDYEKIVLIGFSMGGSITLKYLGVNAGTLPDAVSRAVAFSTPCDLKSGAEVLNLHTNKMYRDRFLQLLEVKLRLKAEQFPGWIDIDKLQEVKVWEDFDNHFSAPLNGYADAQEFYRESSSLFFIPSIKTPTLLINALNDPILTPACSPMELAKKHSYFYLETPATGGHVGFSLARDPHAWSEYRAWDFVQSEL